MNTNKLLTSAAILAVALLFPSSCLLAGTIPKGFTAHDVEVNGVRLHYLVGGKGRPVVLLHGYAQTSHMWNPLMPLLASNHTVIVPDLRGAGGSGKPESGYDKKNMAVDIHELATSLGFKRANIVGHDIGLMVAYVFGPRRSRSRNVRSRSTASSDSCPHRFHQRTSCNRERVRQSPAGRQHIKIIL